MSAGISKRVAALQLKLIVKNPHCRQYRLPHLSACHLSAHTKQEATYAIATLPIPLPTQINTPQRHCNRARVKG